MAGTADEEFEPFVEDGLSLVPVTLSAQEVEEFYEGFSNGTLWPLYHDVIAKPEFHREWWDSYVAVNERFADRAAEVAAEDATVWVQDYQLQLVPQMLRERRPDLRIGFYLHIPFPRASCSPSCRGAARSSRACSVPTSSASSSPAPRRTSYASCAAGSATRRTATRSTSPTAAR